MTKAATGKTILIIDDDVSLRKVGEARLKQEGYRVVAAEGGPEGLRLAKAERPDVILLDLLMPGMDGRQVLRRLQGDEETKAIPVILWTIIGKHDALYDDTDLQDVLHVSKPYHPQELLQQIQKVLSG